MITFNLLPTDKNGREINITHITNAMVVGDYPKCLLRENNNKTYNPIDERIMSLDGIDSVDFKGLHPQQKNVVTEKVFFFIYNTDNYYHFIYDTLPYLISYFKLKKKIKGLKLLMKKSTDLGGDFYPFVFEFLELLGVNLLEDIIYSDDETLYEKIFFSSSYTHGIDSNLPPRQEIFDLYNDIVNNVCGSDSFNTPKNIYISRRSWLHNDFSNIGTNYTTRRKLENENELFDQLKNDGYVEVFTEKLTTIEKIKLFANAKNIIGPIGGGLCNVVFSPPTTKLLSIISPTFLDINNRFRHCLDNVNSSYYYNTKHIETNYWKRHMRVKHSSGIIGEVENVINDELTIKYVDRFVAGWNSEMEYKTITIKKIDCVRLDNGLNSSWVINNINEIRLE